MVAYQLLLLLLPATVSGWSDVEREFALDMHLLSLHLGDVEDSLSDQLQDIAPSLEETTTSNFTTLYTDIGDSQAYCSASFQPCGSHANCHGDDADVTPPTSPGFSELSGPMFHCAGVCVKNKDLEYVQARSHLSQGKAAVQSDIEKWSLPNAYTSCAERALNPSILNVQGCCFSVQMLKDGMTQARIRVSRDPKDQAAKDILVAGGKQPPPPVWNLNRGCTDPTAVNYDANAVEQGAGGNEAACEYLPGKSPYDQGRPDQLHRMRIPIELKGHTQTVLTVSHQTKEIPHCSLFWEVFKGCFASHPPAGIDAKEADFKTGPISVYMRKFTQQFASFGCPSPPKKTLNQPICSCMAHRDREVAKAVCRNLQDPEDTNLQQEPEDPIADMPGVAEPPPTCEFTTDQDMPGDDLLSFKGIQSAEKCGKLCGGDPHCKAWVYGKKEGQAYAKTCFFKSSGKPNRVDSDCCDAGMPCTGDKQPDYKSGKRGVKACPSAYEVITDPATCKAGAEALGHHYTAADAPEPAAGEDCKYCGTTDKCTGSTRGTSCKCSFGVNKGLKGICTAKTNQVGQCEYCTPKTICHYSTTSSKSARIDRPGDQAYYICKSVTKNVETTGIEGKQSTCEQCASHWKEKLQDAVDFTPDKIDSAVKVVKKACSILPSLMPFTCPTRESLDVMIKKSEETKARAGNLLGSLKKQGSSYFKNIFS